MNDMSGPPVAARVRALAPGKLAHLLTQGRACDAINLALGIPGAPPTPPALIEEACSALRAGYNQYEIPDGNPELRRQIAATLTTLTDPDTELTITAGATEALTVAMLSTVNPGDEVIVFEPFYENFLSAIALANGIPRLVRTYPPDWRYDHAELTAAFGPRTRAIVLSNPNNPTGHVLSPAELLEIAQLCERWNAVAVSDEIYAAYLFDGHRHISASEPPVLRERSMVIGSLSKSHAVSGWRLGYLRANATLSAAVRQVHLTVCAGTAAPLQRPD
ncbi:MAG: aminotransferase class I/II-fold pyridoxal phosphate-dependent enzyme, partial [Actinomycetota bacterium]|nr:aminotransferase class I/II-fold pyridoxal phosphate-dependent enzyme [Actinomycetota bacterium]